MSKINIQVDTQEKTVKCDIDGDIFEGLKNAYIFAGRDFEGNPYIEVDLAAETEKVGSDDDVRKMVRLSTAENTEAKTALAMNEGKLSPDKTLICYSNTIDFTKIAMDFLGKSIK